MAHAASSEETMLASSHRPFVPSWSTTPIPGLALSAGGLLALADLNTIAQRTAITGGSSWLDAFVLAPGLHYQQAADALDRHSPFSPATATSDSPGEPRRYVISNAATLNYLKKLRHNEAGVGVVTLHVRPANEGESRRADAAASGFRRRASALISRRRQPRQLRVAEEALQIDWLSHLFYLLSPLLTVAAVVFMALLEDWWGLSFIIALMLSRTINIYCIKERSRPAASSPAPPPPLRCEESRPTEYTVDLGRNRRVVLRGLDADLQAVTTQNWLRAKSTLDGYLEATAKLIVYLIACFSGNLTQAGAMVLMSLLLTSAGLLGMSNAHARSLQMHGRRVGRLRVEKAKSKPLDPMTTGDTEMGGID